MKRSKFAIVAILITVVAMVAPASAFIGSQNIETKAERMVDIASSAQQTILDIATRVESDTTASDLLETSDLKILFYEHIAQADVDGEGGVALIEAQEKLSAFEYESAIASAREALEIFRNVLRSINDILIDAGIETGEILDSQLLQEAIDRSRDRIAQLTELLADEDLLLNLDEATGLLDVAQGALTPIELEAEPDLEGANEALMAANLIISDVCRQLRTIAQELNPGRITSYLAHARQYKEQFQERFGHAWDEDINVDAVAQMLGYENEQDFMGELQGIINSAENKNMNKEAIREVIQNLKELGQMIKNMDNALKQEYGNNGNGQGNGNGLAGNGKGYGNMGGGNSS